MLSKDIYLWMMNKNLKKHKPKENNLSQNEFISLLCPLYSPIIIDEGFGLIDVSFNMPACCFG